jgi:co-chaperonin GroES (HSP10)
VTQLGQAIPILRKHSKTIKQFMLELHEFEPAAMEPIGDRYVVETLFVEETVQFGSLLVYTPQADIDPRDPAANPKAEKRGVLPAVIIAVGNGHLLGLPDPRIAVRNVSGRDEVERHPADVPMFCKAGDVVLVDMNYKGKALKIADREVRVVNAIDILIKLPVRLIWTDEGWVREDAAVIEGETAE